MKNPLFSHFFAVLTACRGALHMCACIGLLIVLTVGTVQKTNAQTTYTFNGPVGVSSDWHNTATWLPNGIPTITDSVFVPYTGNEADIVINQPAECRAIQFASSCMISFHVNAKLRVKDSLRVFSGYSLANYVFNADSLIVGGNLFFGAVKVDFKSTKVFCGGFVNRGASTITLTSDTTFVSGEFMWSGTVGRVLNQPGVIVLNGSTRQSFFNQSNKPLVLNKVVLNNKPGGFIDLWGDTAITVNNLTMVNGAIRTTRCKLEVDTLNYAGGQVFGGWLRRKINGCPSGFPQGIFPMGDSLNSKPFAFTCNSISAVGKLSVKYDSLPGTTVLSVDDNGTNLTCRSNNYFTVQAESGLSLAGINTNGSGSFDPLFQAPNLRVVKTDSTVVGTHVSVSNTPLPNETRSGISQAEFLGRWSPYSTVNMVMPLPNLIDFHAWKNFLIWQFDGDDKTMQIVLEFASQIGSWNSVGSWAKTKMTYKEEISAFGFYRLKLTDANGKVNYSDVIEVREFKESGAVTTFYDQGKKSLVVVTYLPMEFEIQLIELGTGKIVINKKISSQNNVLIPMEEYSKGLYVIRINYASGVYRKKELVY